MNTVENHADIGVAGILSRGKNTCTDPEVGTCLAGLRTAEWLVGPLEWKECRHWNVAGSELTRQAAVVGKWDGCLCSY